MLAIVLGSLLCTPLILSGCLLLWHKQAGRSSLCSTATQASRGLAAPGRICSCTDTRPVTYEFCALLNNMAELAARELERDALIHTAQDSMQAVPATSAR